MPRPPSPRGINYEPVAGDNAAIMLRWLEDPESDTDGYEIRGGGIGIVRAVGRVNSAIIRGLVPARHTTIELRAVKGRAKSDWESIEVRPSNPLPIAPTSPSVGVVQIIDADRQSVQMRLPRADGSIEEVKFTLWWSTTDNSWWGALEVPVNTPAVRSRSLSLNVGMLDDVPGILAGNLVMRSTQTEGTDEPDRQSFVNQSHQIRWEPT